jgi:hypothetical protein
MDAHQLDDTGSDAELLDNWDVVDTDEAADASLCEFKRRNLGAKIM